MTSINDDKLKFERIKEMPQLKREIISYLFNYLGRKKQGHWWHYNGEFKYEGTVYDLECDCMWDNQMFTYKNLHIQHKQIIVDAEYFAETGIIS